MSLDLYLTANRPTIVFEMNVTHNLTGMAHEAGIYEHLWHPEEVKDLIVAGQLIQRLDGAIAQMKAEPARFKKHQPTNGWGTYDEFLKTLEQLLTACRENPDATIRVSR